MPIEFRFTTGDKAIADDIARQYGGKVESLEGPLGGYEVVADIVIENAEGDAADEDVA